MLLLLLATLACASSKDSLESGPNTPIDTTQNDAHEEKLEGANEGLEAESSTPDGCQDIGDCISIDTLQNGTQRSEVKGAFVATQTTPNVYQVSLQIEDSGNITGNAGIPAEEGTSAWISIPARSNQIIDPDATNQTWGWCAIDQNGNTLSKHHPSGQTDQGTTLQLPAPGSTDDDSLYYAVRMYGEIQGNNNTTLFVGDDPMVVVRAVSGNKISPTSSSTPSSVQCCNDESMVSWSGSCNSNDGCSNGQTCQCSNGVAACK